MSYYAIYTGHIQNGVFTTWEDCKKEIHKKPKYKKFKTLAEAEDFNKNGPSYNVNESSDLEEPYDIIVYTDGACSRNGTKQASAGYGIYVSENNPLNQCVRLTTGKLTNNVAELTAVIEAIKSVATYKKICIYTDSNYSMLCAGSYGDKCVKKGWPNDIPNLELVKELHTLVKQYSVTLMHVTAHTTKEDEHSVGNREADRLATQSIAN